MSVRFQLKDGYCWLSDEIFLVLVSFEDHRCYQAPRPTHVCFWEGDFNCIFDVMKITRLGSNRDVGSVFLKRVKLNDHDHKKNQWTLIPISSTQVLSLAGGPNYASGYQVNNSLTFEISYKIW